MKRVLIFSYFFPPANESASRRIGCFAKFLPDFGWLPSVVCGDWNETNCDCDLALLDGIDPASILASVSGERSEGWPPNFAGRLTPKKQKILIPKQYPGQWTQNVLRRMEEICGASPFDAVLGSCGPASSLLLARESARRLQIPWVADFRDLAGQAGIPRHWKPALIALRLQQAERRLAQDAASVTTTTKEQAEMVRQWFRKPVHVVRNGFDPDLFTDLPPRQPSQKFEFVHAGSLYAHRSPEPFLSAVASLIERGEVALEDVSFKFYGEPEGSPFLQTLLSDFPFPELVTAIPKVSAETCRNAFRQASLLMLPGEGGQVTVGAKLYEYIASGIPTIVAPPVHPAAREVIELTGAGFLAESREDLQLIVLRCYSEWKRTGFVSFRANESEIQKFSRWEQTRSLASVLDSIAR